MAKKKKPKADSPIQFRPGRCLDAPLRKFAKEYNLTLNEAARRLVMLALHGLGAGDYLHVMVMAARNPNLPTFAQALAAASSLKTTTQPKEKLP